MDKLKIGITIGDINGIGPEVILKALSNPGLMDLFTPVIYGSSKIMSYHRNIVNSTDFSFVTALNASKAILGKINIINCWEENVNISLGKATEESGRYAHIALDRASTELQNGYIDAIVTAPINKKAMEHTSFNYPGHTEFFTEKFSSSSSLMMLVSEQLKIALASNHVPVSVIADELSRSRILEKANLLSISLRRDFGIDNPTIAILGLNPHAGDEGKLGSEELEFIGPAIQELKEKGILAFGPYSADGFFGSGKHKKFDCVLAMYHDQGLIPFKTLSFGNGVNITAGLSIVRTSPDHGTGYDIAGKNMANPESMRQAIYLALDIVRKRKEYDEMHENPLRKKPKLTEEVEE